MLLRVSLLACFGGYLLVQRLFKEFLHDNGETMKKHSKHIDLWPITFLWTMFVICQKIEGKIDWNWFWILFPMFVVYGINVIVLVLFRCSQEYALREAKRLKAEIDRGE
jgi:hypothetical protein